MSKWVKPGSMGKVAPGYDVRIVNNMGKVTSMSRVAVFIFRTNSRQEVPRGEQGNIGVRIKPEMPPGLFKVTAASSLTDITAFVTSALPRAVPSTRARYL